MHGVYTPIFNAIQDNDLEKVKELLNHPEPHKRINIEKEDTYKRTPLMLAATFGHLEIMKYLVENGANLQTRNTYGQTLLMLSLQFGYLDCMQYLIDLGVPIDDVDHEGNTALHIAIKKRNGNIIKLLLKNNADINKRNLKNDPCLLTAIEACADENILKILIEEGKADIHALDNFGHTALHRAAQKENISTMKYLLAQGADIEATDKEKQLSKVFRKDYAKFGRREDSDGYTPLISAVLYQRVRSVNFLIQQKADVNATDTDGSTPLIHASNNQEITKILLQNNADINCQNKFGKTALMEALFLLNEKTTKTLLENGANIYLKDNNGESALTRAMRYSHQEAAKLVLKKWMEGVTPNELKDLKQTNPKELQKILIAGELLAALRQQAYEQQLESYIAIRDILPSEQKKEFENHIRSKRKEKDRN